MAWGANVLRSWGWLPAAATTAAGAEQTDPNLPDPVSGTMCPFEPGPDWVEQASDKYGKLADKWQWHHLYPKYLGGPDNGPLVRLPAAAHQMISNGFRTLAPYGEWLDDPDELNRIIREVYDKFPLDPGWQFKGTYGAGW